MRRHGRCSIGGRHAFVGVGRGAVGGVVGVRFVGCVVGLCSGPPCSALGSFAMVQALVRCVLGGRVLRRFLVVVVPASFGVVEPEIPPLPSFPRSPGKKGDGSLGGPLASAKGAGFPSLGARARPFAGDRAGRGV